MFEDNDDSDLEDDSINSDEYFRAVATYFYNTIIYNRL